VNSRESFNIGTGMATTLNQLADMLIEVADKTHLKATHSKPKKGDIKHSEVGISRAKMSLHYQLKISLKEGLKDLTKMKSICP
jgi:UDP-glucose 4-epimerase